jgi:hypothetical protein
MAVSFADYAVGSTFNADNKSWTITSTDVRRSKSGRNVRVFTVRCEDGITIQKTSRGLTFWINGESGDESEEAEERDENTNLAAAIATAVRGYMENAVDEDAVAKIAARVADERMKDAISDEDVAKIVDKCLASRVPQRVEVVRLDGTKQDMGVQHTHFAALLRIVACRLNGWLVGPAGSGKTSAGFAVAEALGLPFYAVSVGPQTSKADLLGYMDANGRLVRTQLREAFENGGVFILDEVDAGNPSVLVTINSLLANGHAGFPDKMVAKHPDFVLVACANTIGQGGDMKYVGRNQIDAATLDRFVFLNWENDPRIEAAGAGIPLSCLAGLPMPKPHKFYPTNEGADDRCVEFVQKTTAIRLALAKLGNGVRMIVGNRSNLHGCKLIRAGWTVEDALNATVWRGCDKDTRSKVEANAR